MVFVNPIKASQMSLTKNIHKTSTFIYSYVHLFRKLYIHAYDYEHEVTWKGGVFSFMFFQVVVFFGLVLCCTHLSDITLTIAANIMHTFFFFYGKFY